MSTSPPARGRRGAPAGRRSRPGRPAANGTAGASGSRNRTDRADRLEHGLDAAAAAAPASEPTSFDGLGLPADLVTTLARRGLTAPFAIQSRALPDALAGRDVLARAQTGSGKTLAFGLPLLTRLAPDARRAVPGRPRGLILAPTRELAQQVTDALAPLGQPLGIKLAAVYGGAPMGRQIKALRGGVDVVVATPGRLIDLIEQAECSLADVRVTVLDEADHMADLGFLPAVTKLLDMTATGGQRLLFSATLDRGVAGLVDRYLDEPALHAVAASRAAVDSMDHRVFTLDHEAKLPVATRVAARPGRSLFFVRTKHGADRLARQLRGAGVACNAIHGGLTQRVRTRALAEFADGAPRVLVATDVAARGIHVDDVDLVVHFDPPADHKDYLHRSGRTARAGASGTVLSLVLPDQVRALGRLHERASVSARADTVHAEHAAVEDVATSGTPVVVRERATAPDTEAGRDRKRQGRGGGQSRRGQSARDRGASHGQGSRGGTQRGPRAVPQRGQGQRGQTQPGPGSRGQVQRGRGARSERRGD